jgi:condensation domain-containing protein
MIAPRVDAADFARRSELEARLLRERRGKAGRIPVLARQPGESRFPAAVSQQGMWQAIHQQPGPALAIVSGLRLHGPLDVATLTQAWNMVIARHETLRTALRVENGRLTQVIAEHLAVSVEVTDLVDMAGFDEISRHEVDRPFPLEERPLARLRLLRLAHDDHIALLLVHHIIAEARTLEVIVRDLAVCYHAAVSGTEPVLPELPVQWPDFAAWHAERLAGTRGAELIGYWSARMAGAVPAILPTDIEPLADEPPRQAQLGGMVITPVGKQLFARVWDVAKAHHTTLYTVGLVAFAVLLARHSGQRDIGMNAPISYRDRTELRDLVADFSNDVIVRVDLSANPTFGALIRATRDQVVRDFAYHDLPPHLLAPHLDEPGLVGRMAQVQFTAEREPEIVEQVGGLRVERVNPPRQYVLRPLSLRFRHDDEDAVVLIRYRANRFTAARVERLAADYVALLGELTGQQDRRVLG